MNIIREKCCGEERAFCFSLRVLRDILAKFGSFDEMFNAVDGADSVEAVVWLISRLMLAGDRCAKMNGEENPKPLSEDEILDMSLPQDIGRFKSIVFATLAKDSESSVEIESEGNPTPAGT